jgi:hypothetical protein
LGRIEQSMAVPSRALAGPSRISNLATFCPDAQKWPSKPCNNNDQASNQPVSCNENDDEYAGKLTGLAFQSHTNSHRGHIFATSNFSTFRIHSPSGEMQIYVQLSEI